MHNHKVVLNVFLVHRLLTIFLSVEQGPTLQRIDMLGLGNVCTEDSHACGCDHARLVALGCMQADGVGGVWHQCRCHGGAYSFGQLFTQTLMGPHVGDQQNLT